MKQVAKSSNQKKVLIVGCGHMGESHARAYLQLPQCQIAGLVSRGKASREALAKALNIGSVPLFSDFATALRVTRPSLVCISTYPETHAPYAIAAMKAGCDVFLEKPIATTLDDARETVRVARETGRKLMVGYILRHHPSWQKFVEIAGTLGKPLVMRMSLNQQSSGHEWEVHRKLMASLSPMEDCGVHYVDMMCQMVRSKPVKIQGITARLTEDIAPDMVNYGQLQVQFEDGSVGWYEAGWGPMMSEEGCSIKDVVGPNGSVSMVAPSSPSASDDVASHTKTNSLRIHYSGLKQDGTWMKSDSLVDTSNEPSHDDLCLRQQKYFLRVIEEDMDMTVPLEDSVNSLHIVLAARKQSLSPNIDAP